MIKNGHYELAAKRYKAVANLLSSATLKDRNDRIKSQQLKIAAQSNLSLCYLKLGDYLQCKNFCDAALALDVNNEKCLFRRGQAQVAFCNFDQAMKDFETVLKINPSNAAAQQQMDYCHERSKQQKSKQKESYQAFFNDPSKSSLFEIDEKVRNSFLQKQTNLFFLFVVRRREEKHAGEQFITCSWPQTCFPRISWTSIFQKKLKRKNFANNNREQR